MKKILIATGIAALAFASVASAVFNTNLTVGSTGADVAALQTWLVANGFSIPAIQSGAAQPGYFGSQTKAAVMLYQASRSIPNTGFVGPLTRGALNAGGGAVVILPPAACPIGYTCTPNAGTVGTIPSTPGVITTVGAEGVITTKLAAAPVADSNIRTVSNVPGWGIEVKAQGSDMNVDRVLLQMQVGVGSAGANLSNPGLFVRAISAWDGSKLLKTWNVGPADFNKDSSDRYYIILTGINFVVPKDATRSLTFNIDVIGVSSDQSSRYVTLGGYAGNSQNVRAIDGKGLSSYSDMSGSSNSRVQVFTTSGTSNVTTTANAGLTPKSTNNRVSTTDGVKKLTMQVIDVKSETGASTVKTVYVAVNATSSAGLPSTLYLYDGSTMLASVAAPTTVGTQAGFTDLTIPIAQDATKQLTVKADFPSTVGGQAASTSVPTNGIKWEKPDSTSASTTPSSTLAGNDQYLYTAAPAWTLVGTPTITTAAGVVGVASSSVSGTIKIRATAFGGAMTKPISTHFSVVFASSTQTSYTAANSVTGGNLVMTVSPTDATVGDGGTYDVTLTDTVYSSDSEIGASQPLFMAIKDIDSTVGGNAIANQTWGLQDFYTPAAQLTRGTF